MPFTLIKGSFRVVATSPDGDSVRFFPDNPELIRGLPGVRPAPNIAWSPLGLPVSSPVSLALALIAADPLASKFAQLRMEGIDALETHYVGRRQPVRWGNAATDRLLDFTKIQNVQWDAKHTTIVKADDGTRGWILSRQKDKFNRPVAFLFAGKALESDGEQVVLKADRMRDSYNYAALAEGLAYPTYYEALYSDLRNELTAAVKLARSKGRGLWADDGTTAGFNATNIGVIIDHIPILPKLFRRLSDYMAARGTAEGFREALALGEDAVWDLRTQNRTHLQTFVEQAVGTTKIRMTRDPEELVFDPMPTKPANYFAIRIGAPISGEGIV